MSNDDLMAAIKDLATGVTLCVGRADWYLFGSASTEASNASDIDLVIVCQSHAMADAIRRTIDVDQLKHPIHLSILTEEEEREIHFVERQRCVRVF